MKKYSNLSSAVVVIGALSVRVFFSLSAKEVAIESQKGLETDHTKF